MIIYVLSDNVTGGRKDGALNVIPSISTLSSGAEVARKDSVPSAMSSGSKLN